MVNMIQGITEMIEYVVLGFLLYYMIRDYLLPKKGAYTFATVFLIIQYIAVRYLFSYNIILRKILYGETMVATGSKTSIIPMTFSLLVSLVVCLLLYEGGRYLKVYLVITFYSIMELSRFLIFSFYTLIIKNSVYAMSDYYATKKIDEMEHYIQTMTLLQFIWNHAFSITFCIVVAIVIRKFKKCFGYKEEGFATQEIHFLMIPSVIGLLLAILLRSILFSQKKEEYFDLFEENSELYFLIPLISLLCILSIVYSAKVLQELLKYHVEKRLRIIYENQVSDMNLHIREMEHLYDGLRGMKHDLKNYVFEIETLLKDQTGIQIEYEQELQDYLSGICTSLEKLDMKYQTGNPIMDVVVNHKGREAAEHEIPLSCEFIYPKELSISAFDMSIILNNGLENAIEACKLRKEHMGENDTYITLRSYRRGNMFFLEITNPFWENPSIDQKTGDFVTIKEEKELHGMGLKNIKNTAGKYYGDISCDIQSSVFKLTVMLQGKQIKSLA